MNETIVNSSIPIPIVDDSDIEVAERYLGFSFDAPRRQILHSNESFDVQACPGSGKTTLLVAKLAILGAKWPHDCRGICILSHTNVARKEIEKKLTGTAVKHRLLTYPHFVGTIHGFVNEFLALPMLRSEGYRVSLIDDDACFDWIKHRLKSWPNCSSLGNLPYQERTLDKGIRALVGANELASIMPPSGISNKQWEVLLRVKREAINSGLWFFADMFAWAERLLENYTEVLEFTRWRFPAVFLDEMQDTSELQGSLLNKIFPASACNLRQRFGDSNQAIYDIGQQAASTERFPVSGFRSLPNSQRFGANIAAKVLWLAPDPPSPALAGEGPCPNKLPCTIEPNTMPHTIFLFNQKTAQQVLPAFGKLLLQTFPDEVIFCDEFLARAIGRIGKPETLDERFPRRIGDYWEHYNPRTVKLEPKADYLVDYIHLIQRKRVYPSDCVESIKMMVKGIRQLIRTVKPTAMPHGAQTMRWLWEALQKDEPSVISLRNLLWEWCIEAIPIVEKNWVDKVGELRRALSPIIGTEWNDDANTFCRWSVDFIGKETCKESKGSVAPNIYRFNQGKRFVDIEVGTIHSAKGQNHTATLLLETFFRVYDLEDVVPWLLGEKHGAPNEKPQRLDRLRLVYTAVTRPSHLLCLAMRRDAIIKNGSEAKIRQQLNELGWIIKDLGADEGVS